MKNTRSRISVIFLAIPIIMALFSGCEDNPTEFQDYDAEPVLYAYLYNGRPVGDISLQRVAPLYSYYDITNTGIAGADIVLYKTDNPAAGDTVHFIQTGTDGVYSPVENHIVQGLGHYRIEAFISADESLWAETVVPDTFTVVMGDSVTYTPNMTPLDTLGTFTRDDPEIVSIWSESAMSKGMVATIICQTPIDSLEGLDPDWEPEDMEDEEEPGRLSMTIMTDYQNLGIIPWIAFEWVGWHKISLLASDEPYFDYMYSYFRTQQGGLTNPLYNVNGGLGVFCGVCAIDYMIYMEKVDY